MMYSELYCQQDVNILRSGINAFRESVFEYPLNLNIFNYLTALISYNMKLFTFLTNMTVDKIFGVCTLYWYMYKLRHLKMIVIIILIQKKLCQLFFERPISYGLNHHNQGSPKHFEKIK